MNHQKHNQHQHQPDQMSHAHHEQMFRHKFWISLILSIPVLIFSPSIQAFLGYSLPDFPGSQWITMLFSVVVFFYGGLPFLKMALPEIHKRQPGMMTLISMAILVAFTYSLIALFLTSDNTFFWELVTLIDIMLLGHWIEMRSVRQASRRKMIQNLFWAAGYNVIALPLAAGILAPFGIVLSPAVGALLMSLSTVIVAINAQLLRNVKLSEST